MRKRDDDDGDDDGNCKAAIIYIALLCAKHWAKHPAFVIESSCQPYEVGSVIFTFRDGEIKCQGVY